MIKLPNRISNNATPLNTESERCYASTTTKTGSQALGAGGSFSGAWELPTEPGSKSHFARTDRFSPMATSLTVLKTGAQEDETEQ
jgi:hypothetical protein